MLTSNLLLIMLEGVLPAELLMKRMMAVDVKRNKVTKKKNPTTK